MPKILYVEDNEDSRNLLFRRLQLEGNYEVLLAKDGLEGVAKAREVKPDLILLDMGLPVLYGWEASSRIKANPETKHIPIIALTAHATAEDREEVLKSGCDDYHSKPIRMHKLLHQIEFLLKKQVKKETEQNVTKEIFQTVSMDIQIAQSRILVVDDAQENRNMLSTRISLEGYIVETAENGEMALEMINNTPFDLVLLDIMMPVLNGFHVLHSIRRKYSLLDMPVIIVTARDSQADVIKALEEGANDYITKPIEMKTLLAHIHTQLRVHYLSWWKDRFLSIASHDLKNPLSIIYGYIDIITKIFLPGAPLNKELYTYLLKIKKNAEIMKHIITEILDLKTLEDGQIKLAYCEVDLLNLIRETVEGFQPVIRDKNISLYMDQEREIINIRGDEEKLTRVIQNLLFYALKSCVPKTQIKIKSRQQDQWASVEINHRREAAGNQGIAKSPTPDVHLEDMFPIGEKEFSPGLITAKLLIVAHGGRIGFEKNPDKTTTVRFCLPLE